MFLFFVRNFNFALDDALEKETKLEGEKAFEVWPVEVVQLANPSIAL